MASEVIQLVAKISADAKNFTGEVAKAKKGMKELVHDAATQTKDIAQSVAVGAGAIGAAIAGGLALSAGKAQEVRNALGEVASLGVKDLDSLKNAATDFSNKWSGTSAPDFIRSAYDIKSAVSSLSDEAVAKFAEYSAITAKATKASAEEMSKAFTTAYGIFKPLEKDMSDMDWADKFSGTMSAAVQQFKTDGKQMADAIKSIGAIATASNVPLAEQTAILGTLQQTMPGAEAGTQYKAFMMTAAKAGEAMKLSFVNANGALKSTPEILEEIKKKFPDLSSAAAQMKLKEAFGSEEAVKYVLQLTPKIDELKGGITAMGEAWENGSAGAVKMAEAMNTDKIELFKQQFGNLMAQIGEFVLTALGPLLADFSKFVLKLQAWIKENPELTKTIVIVTAAIGGLALAIAAIATVVAGIAGVIAIFSGAAMVAVAPVIGIIAIVIGVIATLALIANVIKQNWGPISIFFEMLWDGIKNAFSTAWTFIKSVVQDGWTFIVETVRFFGEMLVKGVTAVWEAISGAFMWYINKVSSLFSSIWEGASSAIDAVKAIFAGLFEYIAPYWENFKNNMAASWEALKQGPTAFATHLLSMFKNAFDKVLAMAAQLWEKIKNIPGALLDKMKDAVGLGDGEAGAVPAMAKGGIVTRPTFALIGEAGPEAVIPLNGGGIPVNFDATTDDSGGAKTMGNSPDVFNIYQQPGESAEALAKKVSEYKMKKRGWV